MRYRLYITFVIFPLILLLGCTTKTIKIDPIPELKIGSPLSSIEPLTFKFNKFEDVRPYKKKIGICTNPQVNFVIQDQEVNEIIVQTIANELKRNGHKVLQAGETDKADVVIEGIVRSFWLDGKAGFVTITYTSAVETDITVTTQHGSDKPLSKTYKGNFHYSDRGFIGALEHFITQALLDMIKEFTTDEEFLNKIKMVQNSRK